MTDEDSYLLTCLIEEAAEVIQAASKIKRFGPRGDEGSFNHEKLHGELGDLKASAALLVVRGFLEPSLVTQYAQLRIRKLSMVAPAISTETLTAGAQLLQRSLLEQNLVESLRAYREAVGVFLSSGGHVEDVQELQRAVHVIEAGPVIIAGLQAGPTRAAGQLDAAARDGQTLPHEQESEGVAR